MFLRVIARFRAKVLHDEIILDTTIPPNIDFTFSSIIALD